MASGTSTVQIRKRRIGSLFTNQIKTKIKSTVGNNSFCGSENKYCPQKEQFPLDMLSRM